MYTQNNNRYLLFIIKIITIVLSVHRWLCLLLLCLFFFCENICPTFKILIGAEQDLIFFFFIVCSFSHFLLFLMNKNFINQNMEKCLIMVIFKNVQRMEDVPLCNLPDTYILNIKKVQDIIKNKNKCILYKKIVCLYTCY